MELTNEQRKCLGLELIHNDWTRVEIGEGKILYFDKEDIIRKEITINKERYSEYNTDISTQNNRTLLSPRTPRGKVKKLTVANLERITPYGTYFSFYKGWIRIGNFTTQTTFYDSDMAGVARMDFEGMQNWLDKWVKETDEKEFEKIKKFATASRKHCKFRKGDYFRFAVDRNTYGYGRILLDIDKLRKANIEFLDVLFGKPLIVEVFHILTDNPNIKIEELEKLKTFPSQNIMDNIFYYGECEIIGNGSLPKLPYYPIMYGMWGDLKFQCGEIYKKIPYDGTNLITNKTINNSIGFNLKVNKKIIERCIKENSNDYYWKCTYDIEDLRSPINQENLKRVLEQFDLKELEEIYID